MKLNDIRPTTERPLEVPIGGKTYRIKPISADLGLRFQDLMAVTAKAQAGKETTDLDIEILSDSAEQDFYMEALGEAGEQMLRDGVTFVELKTAALFAIIHAVYGEEMAERFWNAGGKAEPPNRAARRTETRTHTGAATTTLKRASRTGTTTRKATAKKAG